MTARLLMIGIDGADSPGLDRGSLDGSLPHLAALRARGRAHRLTAPPGVTDDAIWASFQYEAELGEHGRFNFRLPLSDGRLGMAFEEERDRPIFWDALSDEGMRVAIVDVPKCRTPRPLNGIHLADWSVHGRYFPEPQSQPIALAADVLNRFGPAQPSRCNAHQPALDDDAVREIAGHLRASVAQKRAAGLHFLEAEPWDLFVIGFKEAHCASHAFWNVDSEGASGDISSGDGTRAGLLGNPLASVLRDIDDAVGALVASAGPAAEIVVFSTTEYQANGTLEHLMPAIVKRLNARVATSRIERALGRIFRSGASTPPDWRIAILPYNENCVALRIVSGGKPRFAPGDAPPGDAILATIEAELIALRDAETKRPVVSSITRPSSELAGTRAGSLPDLLIHCVGGAIPRAVVSPGLGRIEGRPPSLRTGNHVAGGVLFAAGGRASASSMNVRSIAALGALARTLLAEPA